MSVLRRKTRRDIRRQLGPFAAIVVLIMLGTALFVASYDAYRNLDRSYRALFAQLRFADVTISGGPSTQIADRVAAIDGVTAVMTRTVADTPIRVADHKLIGRVVGVPDDAPAPVNRVAVIAGDDIASGSDDVLVEQHLAGYQRLRPGDDLRVHGRQGWRDVRVAGIAASTEYLWPARSRQDVFPSPDSFGVVFVPQPLAVELAGRPNEVLVRVADTDQRARVIAEVRATAMRTGAAAVSTRAQQASNAVLQEDIAGFQELAVMFPLLFLSAAGMATGVLLRRRVTTERPIIGTLRACGFDRRQVLGHYLQYGLVAGASGSLLGVPLGLVAARQLTTTYTGVLDLPSTINATYPESIVVGVAFGVIAGGVAAWMPARSAARIAPGDAMRGVVPPAGRPGAVTRVIPALDRWPASWRLVVRNLERHPGRTLSTMAGVVLALVLVLASAGMVDTIRALVDRQFSQIDRSDARVVLAAAVDDRQIGALRGVDGVAAVEAVAAAPVTLATGDARYATIMQGFASDTSMHRFEEPDGSARPPPTAGVLLGQALREQLDVEVGEQVGVLDARGSPLGTVDVAGFVDEPMGSPAYVSMAVFERLAPGRSDRTALVRFGEGSAAAAVTDRLAARDDVLAVSRTGALQDTVEQFLGLFYAFVGGMLVCGALLAFGILFTTMSVNLSERSVAVATLRASGVRQQQIARLITAENMLVTLLGIGPGLVLGWIVAAEALATYSNDMFRLELHMSPLTLVLAAVSMLIAALASQVPGLRALRRLSIGDVVRQHT